MMRYTLDRNSTHKEKEEREILAEMALTQENLTHCDISAMAGVRIKEVEILHNSYIRRI